jgi:hypothetical protein
MNNLCHEEPLNPLCVKCRKSCKETDLEFKACTGYEEGYDDQKP